MKAKANLARSRPGPAGARTGRSTRPHGATLRPDQYFSTLVENLADAVIVSQGTIVWCNDRVKPLLGYTKEELIGKEASFFTLEGPDSFNFLERLYDPTDAHSFFRGTTTVRRKDGDTVEVEFTVSRIPDVEPPAFVAVARDITGRKRAEKALTASEEKFRTMFNNVNDEILFTDATGVVVDVNESILRIFGYRPDEVIGRHFNEIQVFDPDELSRMNQLFAKALARGTDGAIFTEVQARHRDGHPIHLEVSTRPIRGDEGAIQGFVNIIRDVTKRRMAEEALQKAKDELERRVKERTAELRKANKDLKLEIAERKQAEEALRHGEEYLRTLIDNSLDAIVILNADGTIRYKNPANERALGYQSEERQGGGPFDHIHPDDVPYLAEQFAQFVGKPGSTLLVEVRVQHKDASWRVMEARGTNLLNNPVVECIVVNMRDITERKMAEEELRESEERYRLHFESITDIVYSVDPSLKLVSISPSVERMLGFKCTELVGRPLRDCDLLAPECVDLAVSDAQRVLAGERISSSEYQFTAKDGTRRFVEVSGSPLYRNDGEVVAAISVARDITERKLAEEELRIKENAIENALNAVAMSDMEGTITYVNRACMQLWGEGEKEEILGKPYWRLLEPPERATVMEIANAMLHNHSWEGELVARRKDGKEVHVHVLSGIVKDERGNPIQTISSFLDITERRRMEEALRRSEEKFRRFLEKMNDGYCVLQGLTVAYVNARCAEMFGYTQDEVIGKSIDELLPHQIVQELVDIYARRQRGEKIPTQYETVLIRKDGSELPVEFGSRLIEFGEKPAVSVVVRDISQRKQMEKALRESEAEFRTIFQEAAIGIALIAMAENTSVLEVNPAFERMFGYSLAEMKRMTSFEYLYPEDALADAGLFQEIVEGKRDHYHIEKRYVRKDGKVIWGHQNLSVVRGAEGQPRYMIAMIEDITERKRAEEEKQRMEQQLHLTGRLAAVGELAAGVAHELNNPLAAVQAYAQFLADQQTLDESIRKDVDIIYREAQRAARITSNLLSFARRHKPEKIYISINDTIDKSLELHAYRMRVNNIEVVKQFDAELPKTMADFYQIQQVFVNLVTNAEQAMTEAHGKGTLTVKTQKAGDMIQATFNDDGPGIHEDNLKRIFDPFFTTKDVGKGTGLGLSICFGIVQEHNGRLYARSTPGRGTTFVVELPVVAEGQASQEEGTSIKTQGA